MSTQNVVWQTVKTIVHLHRVPATMMVNHFAMIKSFQMSSRFSQMVWSYWALQSLIILSAIKYAYWAVMGNGADDSRSCSSILPDQLGCMTHWSRPTRLMIALFLVHVALCYHRMLTMPTSRPYMTITLHPDQVGKFFLSSSIKGQSIATLMRKRSSQILQILSLLMVNPSKLRNNRNLF